MWSCPVKKNTESQQIPNIVPTVGITELEGMLKGHLAPLPVMNKDSHSSIGCSEPTLIAQTLHWFC